MTEKDYSPTLNLPKTNFPMRAGLPDLEPKWLEFWQNINLWQRLRDQSKGREKYVLHDGPPYANGHLHIGHALNKILKDIISRSQQMLGKDSHYVPGWDCHGLPIEWKIEEKYRESGLDKDEVDIVEFRGECREFAKKWLNIQRDEFKRLGINGNWDNPYTTMTYAAEAQIAREMGKFLMDGSLFKGAKPVLWSVVEKTALAEAEVEYKDHKSITIYVRFPINKCSSDDLQDASIVIWTTTPWTIPSNRAIAFHRTIAYGLYEAVVDGEHKAYQQGDKIIVADGLLGELKEKSGGVEFSKLRAVTPDELEGIICRHPLHDGGYDFAVPVHHADFVTDEQGTGFVHVSPAHGADDYFFGLHHGLDIPDNVDEGGVFKENVPLFAGHDIYTQNGEEGSANVAVIRALAANRTLVGKQKITHSYPHSWRSKAPLIFRNTSQWFISMDKNRLREKALKAIDQTQFYPKQGKNRLYEMIKERPDWCLSRQRAWGVPLTIFVHKASGEVLRDQKIIDRICDYFEQEGSDSWFARPMADFLAPDYNPDEYEQVKDVLDVWFDSGSTHAFVLEQRDELKWPADLYLEGSDQHRGWFHSSLLVGCGTRGRAPYDAVLTHGFVLAEDGQKMSKSIGNIVTPQEVHDTLGADILRLWVVASNYSEDLSIGPKILKQQSDSYRRFRNSFRFLLGNLHNFSNDKLVSLDELDELDKWVLHRLYMLDGMMRDRISIYDFHRIFRELHDFCSNDLSSFYFDIKKDVLYCDASDSPRRLATQTVLHHVFEHLSVWLAPILCFTCEEVWQARRENINAITGQGGRNDMTESVHLSVFPSVPEKWRNDGIFDKIKGLLRFRKTVLGALEQARGDKKIGAGLDASPIVYVSDDMMSLTAGLDMADFCITSNIEIKKYQPGVQGFSLPEYSDIVVEVKMASGEKCQRCWKILVDATPENHICTRCHDVVSSA